MQSTRETILTELKRQGGARADDLAKMLDLTPMAIRQHLYQLQDEGAVICRAKPQGRGRPAKVWELTEKADVYFQDSHRDLSLDLIDSVKDLFGQEGMDRLVQHRTQKQRLRYESATPAKCSLKEKLKTLASQRSKEGYMAEVQESDGEFLLLENHCPICEAAKVCSGLCQQELELFQGMFADTATVERTEHALSGGKRCAYRVVPKE